MTWTHRPPDPDVDVPADQTPAAHCRICGRPFRSEQVLALHLGETHPRECTDDEMAAYADAKAEEQDELFYFHLKTGVALGAIYAVVVLLYMVALGSGFL